MTSLFEHRQRTAWTCGTLLVLALVWQGVRHRTLQDQWASRPPGVAVEAPDPSESLVPMIEWLDARTRATTTPDRSLHFLLDLYELPAEDLPQLLAHLDPNSRDDVQFYLALFERWSIADLEGAMKAAATLEGTPSHRFAIQGLFAKRIEADMESLFADARGDRHHISSIGDYVEGLASRDPERALELAARADEIYYGSKGIFVGGVCVRWAQCDPHAALEWAGQHAENRDHAIDAVIDAWSDTSPQEAIQALMAMPLEPSDFDTLGMALGKLASSDPTTAFDTLVDMASTLEGQENHAFLRDQFFRYFSENLWSVDEATLEAKISALDNPLKGELVAELADTEKSAPIGLRRRLTEQLPEGPARAKALRELVSRWYGDVVHQGLEDPAVITDWLNKLPDGPSRDSAIEEWVVWAAMDDPPSSLQGLSVISDPIDRALQARRLGQWLLERDYAGTRALLESSDHLEASDKAWLMDLAP